VDLVEGKKKPREVLAGGLSWLRQQAAAMAGDTGEGGPQQEQPAAYVYNAEVGAWMPAGMSARQFLAQEAEERRQEEMRAAPPPPPSCGQLHPNSSSQSTPYSCGQPLAPCCAAGLPGGVTFDQPPSISPPMRPAFGPPQAAAGAHDTGGGCGAQGALSPAAGAAGFRRPAGKVRLSDHYRAQAGM
jgi:hypothetical protein